MLPMRSKSKRFIRLKTKYVFC